MVLALQKPVEMSDGDVVLTDDKSVGNATLYGNDSVDGGVGSYV
jgi:hypothetical protein